MFEFQLDSAGNVQHIERAAAKRRCMFMAQIAGSVEGSPPKHVGLFVAAASQIIFQGSKRSLASFFGYEAAIQGEANAIRQFKSAMTRYDHWIADFAAPSGHSS